MKQKKEKKNKGCVAAVCAILIIVVGVWLLRQGSTSLTSLSLKRNDQIALTPEQIKSVRDIGQWEFLAVSDEELVDTVRRGFLTNDHLVRIYYGTMRLGIDMSQLDEGWISMSGDSVVLMLPPVALLDEHFVDEARTVSFHESGRWKAQDREDMYQRACRRMLARGLSPQNIATAQDNADVQFRQLMRSMGFSKVMIRFKKQ